MLGHLNNSCPACFLFCNSKQKIGENTDRCHRCFQIGWLNDHLFGKELSILCVSFVNVYQFVRVVPSVFGFEGEMRDYIDISF